MTRRARSSGLCQKCGQSLDPWDRCRRKRCPGYSHLWAGDWKAVLIHNLLRVEQVALVTVTAPGADAGLIWDESVCRHPAGERCSGPKGCRVISAAADRWHDDHEQRWSKLHRAAVASATRQVGRGPIVAAKVWEPQARGLEHLHLVVPYATPRQRAKCDAYVAALKQKAGRYWFGFVDVKRPAREAHGGAAAAVYAGKYVVKSAGESAKSNRPVYVGSYLTNETGVTMRLMRWRRYIWCRLGVRLDGQELRRVMLLLAVFPGIELLEQPANPRAP